jgi:predicted PurR-regulated permease PerM
VSEPYGDKLSPLRFDHWQDCAETTRFRRVRSIVTGVPGNKISRMTKRPPREIELPEGAGSWPVNGLLTAVFFIGTALLLLGCYALARPFLPALAWALALAIVSHPIHCWIQARTRHSSMAAALAVLAAAILVIGPMSFVARTLLNQTTEALETLQSGQLQTKVESVVQNSSRLSRLWEGIRSQTTGKEWAEQFTTAAGKWTSKAVGGSVAGTVTLLIAFFFMFYFLRDRSAILQLIRSLVPLSRHEADQVFRRVRDTIFATIFGTLAVATIQGGLGGLMFWWLGLPDPLLWGVIMGLLAIIPVLGAFVIWIPAAIWLAVQGLWWKAILLSVWGTVVIGLIDNLLYPILVGTRLRLHTVPVFISIVGGLMVFGASGVILGPVVLALTDAVLNVWRCRCSDAKC